MRARDHTGPVVARFLALPVAASALLALGGAARAGLLSHWTFDGTLEDSAGANDGVYRGPALPTFVDDRDGNPASALALNGVDEFVQVQHNEALPLYQHPVFTVAMWVKGVPQNDRRVWSESTTRNRAALYNLGTQNLGQTGQLDFFVRGDDGIAVESHTYSTAQPFDDTWHHIAFIDDNGAGTLYVDGRRDPTAFSYTRPAIDFDITTIGGILRLNDDGTDNICCRFAGVLDDVRIYDHALSEAEVEELVGEVAACPEAGDTHCDDLLVEGPPSGEPGLYTITALDAVDDSGDAIAYTFTRDNGQGVTQTAGPQANNFVSWNLAAGDWTISVTVDDDPLCDDVAPDATCSRLIAVACAKEGDTHCAGLDVTGPADDRPGAYTLTATGSDDSGDAILFTYRAQKEGEAPRQVGPTASTTASFVLTSGSWTLSVTADDLAACGDVADDATCAVDVEVVAAPAELVAHYSFDGHIEDETGNTEALAQSGIEPLFVDGFDGSPEGAASFNGVDDLVVVNLAGNATGGLQLAGNEAYTVAMWVRGGPQADFRVFSEGSTLTNTPLFNIGTQSLGQTGQVDLFVRDGGGQTWLAHRWSAREAFDLEWHHIAWVDEGGDAVLYIDGVRDATDFSYVKPALVTDTTTIGGILRAAPSHYFRGEIDDVRLYNHALSAEEVLALVPEPEDCPEAGDTHCDDFTVTPPEGEGIGQWTFTALDAADDSGDDILYLFTATNAEGRYLQAGPAPSPAATFFLTGGEWTITLTVDDSIRCRDLAADATCSRGIEVATKKPVLLSHWRFDGDLLDSQPAMNHGSFIGGRQEFVDGHDGTPGGALAFDGIDDTVRVAHTDGLPLYHHFAYSVAMWVKGDGTVDNVDDRVWSESTELSNAPLVNIGTHVQGTGPQVDIFIRSTQGTIVNHRLSAGAAFDGTWHHIAWVDENGDAALYIDGERDPVDFRYAKPSLDTMNLSISTIGGILRGGPCCPFTGQIDDVRVFNHRLSDEEVRELYEGEVVEPPATAFVRGDTNSSGTIDLTDGVVTLNFLFLGGPAPSCMDAADTDNNGQLVISDAVIVFSYLFTGGPPPVAPSPSATAYAAADCGEDAEGGADGLDCAGESDTCGA
jgi:hypothetical protein